MQPLFGIFSGGGRLRLKRECRVIFALLLLFSLLCGCAAGAAEAGENTCTISISCATLLDRTAGLTPEKAELVPADGWLLPETQVSFSDGESVFDVLQRICREQKLHMEFSKTPVYDSAYIEGIGNLYEFDAGALSGWVYSVNGWFPNYGCSRYELKDGDVIRWQYTCDLGQDVGAELSETQA